MIFRAGSEKGGCCETLGRLNFLLIMREVRCCVRDMLPPRTMFKMQDTDKKHTTIYTLNDVPGLVNHIYSPFHGLYRKGAKSHLSPLHLHSKNLCLDFHHRLFHYGKSLFNILIRMCINDIPMMEGMDEDSISYGLREEDPTPCLMLLLWI